MSSDIDDPGSGKPHARPLTVEVSDDTIGSVSKPPKTLADRLRFARQWRGLNVNELNRMLRVQPGNRTVSMGYVSSVEIGRRKNISGDRAIALCDALRIRPEWLLHGTGKMSLESGTHQAVYSAAEEMKPNLERVLEAMGPRRRWSAAAANAARGLRITDLSLEVWPNVLDRLHKALDEAISDLDV